MKDRNPCNEEAVKALGNWLAEGLLQQKFNFADGTMDEAIEQVFAEGVASARAQLEETRLKRKRQLASSAKQHVRSQRSSS